MFWRKNTQCVLEEKIHKMCLGGKNTRVLEEKYTTCVLEEKYIMCFGKK